ncbi:MAG TPA: hypothetical protein VL793_06915, partial [Patescibacteria group bacterium]|nr:hypothetical protein [Patescibacteria group bacterium]
MSLPKDDSLENCLAGPDQGISRSRGTLLSITFALLVTLVCLTVPTLAPDLGIDTSWCAVLQWAHERGLQFGKDIVFTYGPFGYLLAPYCLAQPPRTLILSNVVICFGIALGLCLVARRLGIVWRIALLFFFVLESANAEIKADLLLQVGLLCWGLLCIIETGRRQKACVAGFIALAGFTALTKVVYLFVVGFSVGALTIYFMTTNNRKLAWTFIATFSAAFITAWLGSGQNLLQLGPFIQSAFVLSREYDQAAALGGLPLLRVWGIVLGCVVLIALLFRVYGAFGESSQRTRFRKVVLFSWIAGLLLVVWKHSLVRLDRLHFFDLAVFGPVAALALEALPSGASPSRLVARSASICAALLSVYIVESSFLPGVWPSLAQVFAQAVAHTRLILTPAAAWRALDADVEARRQEAQLPELRRILGKATVDVFGFHQAHALLNGLNYKPRPVFQSYVAYNHELARLNEQFYLSSSAPDYVLFELAGLEHRFPAMDDARAFQALLVNYDFAAAESGFLLLKRRSSVPAQMTSIAQGAFNLGQRLDLSRFSGDDLWLEIQMQPTWWGRILKFIYRPAPIRCSVWTKSNGAPKAMGRRQAAPSVLASGFFCRPFFVKTEDIR